MNDVRQSQPPQWRWIATFTALVMMLAALSVEAVQGPPSAWVISATGATAWQGESDLEPEGEVRLDRRIVNLEASRGYGNRWFAGLSLGYGEDRYRFSGTHLVQVWEDVHSLQLGLSLRYKATEDWSLFGMPILRYSAEQDARLQDGREAGLLAGVSYRFNEDLTLGPGFGVFSNIGDEDDLFPILLINWRLTDNLSLETGRGLAASRGPGLALKWRPLGDWEFGLAARYEKFRFRLAGDAEYIAQDKAIPLAATATWKTSPHLTLSALVGMQTAGYLSLENSDSQRLQRLSYHSAPLLGLVASVRF